MRFMMLVIPKGYENAAPNEAPQADAVAKMMKYNEALANAGILLSLDGLKPPSAGARVSFSGGKPKVTDGPFSEAKECVGGYWMIQVKSREEAVEWAKRAPMTGPGQKTEIRRMTSIEDFPQDNEWIQKERAWRERTGQL